jgi:hypothetical protein
MRAGISIKITRPDRRRLEAITKDRNASQKRVWRAAIVLMSADGVGTNEIMRRTGTSKTCVWRWQQRFMEEGVDGLLRDKTRPSRILGLGPEAAERVVALTLADPPRDDPPDGRTDGAGERHKCQRGPPHLEGAWAAASAVPTVQALERSELRRQIARRCRALCRSAGPRHCAVGR